MNELRPIDQEEAVFQFPNWVETLLHKKFFDHCSHHDETKNELNRYCIDCEIEGCRYCIAPGGYHDEHMVLQIYRHVYEDVIPLSAIENHMDCSDIQPYKCNKKWILALNPLPHCGSGSQIDEDLSCVVCKRKLMDPDQYRYCCIACKAEAFTQMAKEGDCETDSVRKDRRKRPRKGLPKRAPFS